MTTKVDKTDEKSPIKPTASLSLAFRVIADTTGLFAPQMLLIEDDIVTSKRTGVFTTLGHAISAADDLMDGWAFSEIEKKPEDYFQEVFL